MNFNKFIKIKLLIIFFFTILNSCGLYKPVDARKVPQNAEEKRRQNIEEGKGVSIKNVLGNRSTNFEFSTSNPLWRASLEILDFIPLTTVDYAGGVIITDWYSDSNQNEYIKISIRFLTNEISANSLKIQTFKKICDTKNVCKTNLIKSNIRDELLEAIVKKAALLDKNNKQ